jgi:hypothetical protein
VERDSRCRKLREDHCWVHLRNRARSISSRLHLQIRVHVLFRTGSVHCGIRNLRKSIRLPCFSKTTAAQGHVFLLITILHAFADVQDARQKEHEGRAFPGFRGGMLRTSTPSQLSCFRRPRLSSWVTVSMNSCNAVNEIGSLCF